MGIQADALHLNIDYVGSSGFILSPEQKASLQSSLTILQNQSKFYKVALWGKLVGTKEHYFIAQGFAQDELREKRVFYSKDGMTWALLPPPTDEMHEKAAKVCRYRLTGDPSYEVEHKEKIFSPDGEEDEEITVVKEEERLSCIIDNIDRNARIVPRGAYIRTPADKVVINRSFQGLSVAEAAKLDNYYHFRDPIELPEKPLLERADMDKSRDFFDSIANDVPRGCWSLQFERGSGLVTLRSLLWPGFTFYHVPGTDIFGSFYIGYGEYNIDLPFMI